MRIGWLADDPGYLGGAELTQAAFRSAAPEGVEIVDCPPGSVAEADRYVVHNCATYSKDELPRECIRYCNDLRDPRCGSTFIFCSPLQRDFMGLEGALVPPPIDLAHFRPPRQHKRNGERKGTCWIGAMNNPGKGIGLALEWERDNEPVDFYGEGPFAPEGALPIPYDKVAQVMWGYEKFLFCPTHIEPFGRAVVEAWAAGCKLILNRNVGARYWIDERPEELETASEDFWEIVCAP